MFEKYVKDEKIHGWTYSHPIYTQMLTGICQAVMMFSYFFHL